MRVLLTGNATCANRGDAAIFRGLLREIENLCPEAEIVCCSRHPIPSEFVLGRKLEPDWIYSSLFSGNSGSFFKKAKALFSREWNFRKLRWLLASRFCRGVLSIPKATREFGERLEGYDAVIHVGGSFFVDLYGVQQFDVMMACALYGKPVYLAGHSMGPFRIARVKATADALLPKVRKIFLREGSSADYLSELGIRLENVETGSDTAWLLPEAEPTGVFDAEISHSQRPLVAVTVRKLAPFDKRLGITQDQYEANVATLLDHVIEKGYHIVGLSMCTGLGGYAHDDRLIAESVRRKLKDPREMTVLWNEYSDLQTGYILSRCKILVGTRLHSAILSLRYGTPALALYYEHKSEGVLKQVGMSDWSIRLQDVASSETLELVDHILDDNENARSRVASAVASEQERTRQMIGWIVQDILASLPS